MPYVQCLVVISPGGKPGTSMGVHRHSHQDTAPSHPWPLTTHTKKGFHHHAHEMSPQFQNPQVCVYRSPQVFNLLGVGVGQVRHHAWAPVPSVAPSVIAWGLVQLPRVRVRVSVSVSVRATWGTGCCIEITTGELGNRVIEQNFFDVGGSETILQSVWASWTQGHLRRILLTLLVVVLLSCPHLTHVAFRRTLWFWSSSSLSSSLALPSAFFSTPGRATPGRRLRRWGRGRWCSPGRRCQRCCVKEPWWSRVTGRTASSHMRAWCHRHRRLKRVDPSTPY